MVSIVLLGCSTFEKNLLFQKNTQNEEQKILKIETKELSEDERKALQNIEKNLENITLNITKLSNKNTETFKKISSNCFYEFSSHCKRLPENQCYQF